MFACTGPVRMHYRDVMVVIAVAVATMFIVCFIDCCQVLRVFSTVNANYSSPSTNEGPSFRQFIPETLGESLC